MAITVDEVLVNIRGTSTGLVRSTTQANAALRNTSRTTKQAAVSTRALRVETAGLARTSRNTAVSQAALRQQTAGLAQTAGFATGAMATLTGGFLAAGGLLFALRASTRAATEFDKEITKIITLVGVAEEQVQEWSSALLELGPATARGPTELARALFVVTSAGERGARAFDILELAAKASAVGLGETKIVARAVTSALQTYREEGLTAAEATDVLVATVREGNLEASDLAGSLGRVLGIAREAGVSFAELGGFVATFTKVGVTAEEATTALRGILTLVINPANEAREALARFRISIDDVRRSVREDGLTRTLINLVEVLREDEDALGAVIGNVRALAGVLSTAGAQAEGFTKTTQNVIDSQGILEEAFIRTKKSADFQFEQAKVSAQAFGIIMGTSVLPQIVEMTAGFKEAGSAIRLWATFIGAIFNTVIGAVRIVTNSIELTFNLMLGAAVTVLGGINTAINFLIIDPLNKLAGLVPGIFALPRLPEGIELSASIMEALVKDSNDLVESIESAAESWAKFALELAGTNSALADTVAATEKIAKNVGAAADAGNRFARAEIVAPEAERGVLPIPIEPPDIRLPGVEILGDILSPVQEALDNAKRIVAETVTAEEEALSLQRDLQTALIFGTITQEEYARAIALVDSAAADGAKSFAELATTVGPAIASVIANVIRAARGEGGGFFGAISGIFAGAASVASFLPGAGSLVAGIATGASILSGAFAGGGKRTTPVTIDSFSSRALGQQQTLERAQKVLIQIVADDTGEILDEFAYEIERRTRTDNIVRIPGARIFRSRGAA